MFPLLNGNQTKGKENLRRDWCKYDEELIVRGTFYLDYSFVKNWKEEPQRMNRGMLLSTASLLKLVPCCVRTLVFSRFSFCCSIFCFTVEVCISSFLPVSSPIFLHDSLTITIIYSLPIVSSVFPAIFVGLFLDGILLLGIVLTKVLTCEKPFFSKKHSTA